MSNRSRIFTIAYFFAGIALVATLCGGCSSLGHAYDGLTSPQGVEDRAQLRADYAVLRAKIVKDAPELISDVETIAADVGTGNYVGVLLSIVAAAPPVIERFPELAADIKTIIEDIRRLGVDAGLADKAQASVTKAKTKAVKIKSAVGTEG